MPLVDVTNAAAAAGVDELLASAARTASGTSTRVQVNGPVTGAVVEIDVTEVAGTSPTLSIDLQDSLDGTNFNKVATLNAANITATGRVVYRLDARAVPIANTVRLAFTLGGTAPSFTFSVRAHWVRA